MKALLEVLEERWDEKKKSSYTKTTMKNLENLVKKIQQERRLLISNQPFEGGLKLDHFTNVSKLADYKQRKKHLYPFLSSLSTDCITMWRYLRCALPFPFWAKWKLNSPYKKEAEDANIITTHEIPVMIVGVNSLVSPFDGVLFKVQKESRCSSLLDLCCEKIANGNRQFRESILRKVPEEVKNKIRTFIGVRCPPSKPVSGTFLVPAYEVWPNFENEVTLFPKKDNKNKAPHTDPSKVVVIQGKNASQNIYNTRSKEKSHPSAKFFERTIELDEPHNLNFDDDEFSSTPQPNRKEIITRVFVDYHKWYEKSRNVKDSLIFELCRDFMIQTGDTLQAKHFDEFDLSFFD